MLSPPDSFFSLFRVSSSLSSRSSSSLLFVSTATAPRLRHRGWDFVIVVATPFSMSPSAQLERPSWLDLRRGVTPVIVIAIPSSATHIDHHDPALHTILESLLHTSLDSVRERQSTIKTSNSHQIFFTKTFQESVWRHQATKSICYIEKDNLSNKKYSNSLKWEENCTEPLPCVGFNAIILGLSG